MDDVILFNHMILQKYNSSNLGVEASKCSQNVMRYYNNGTQLSRANRYCMHYDDDDDVTWNRTQYKKYTTVVMFLYVQAEKNGTSRLNLPLSSWFHTHHISQVVISHNLTNLAKHWCRQNLSTNKAVLFIFCFFLPQNTFSICFVSDFFFFFMCQIKQNNSWIQTVQFVNFYHPRTVVLGKKRGK